MRSLGFGGVALLGGKREDENGRHRRGRPFHFRVVRTPTSLLSSHGSQHTATFHSASLPMYLSSAHEHP